MERMLYLYLAFMATCVAYLAYKAVELFMCGQYVKALFLTSTLCIMYTLATLRER